MLLELTTLEILRGHSGFRSFIRLLGEVERFAYAEAVVSATLLVEELVAANVGGEEVGMVEEALDDTTEDDTTVLEEDTRLVDDERAELDVAGAELQSAESLASARQGPGWSTCPFMDE